MVQPTAENLSYSDMKIDKESFGAFFDGTPGKSWDDYVGRLKNAAAGEVDERGFSLADLLDGADDVTSVAT